MAENIVRLPLFESLPLLTVQILGPGTYTLQAAPYSNSLLATVWVKSLDLGATVHATWYDIGPGSGVYPGERVPLADHGIISTPDYSDRQIVPRLHNKAFCQIVIAGGNAELGVYITAVSTFPTEAPFRDGQNYKVLDAGNANAILDPSDGKFYLQRGPAGSSNVFVVGGVFTEPTYEVKIFTNKLTVTPTIQQTVIAQTVPMGKFWRLRKAGVSTRSYGHFEVMANGDIIGDGYTGPAESNVKNDFLPYWELDEGKSLQIRFLTSQGPLVDFSAFVQLTESSK